MHPPEPNFVNMGIFFGVFFGVYLVVALLSVPCAGYALAKLDTKTWDEEEAAFLIKWSLIWPLLWLIIVGIVVATKAEPAAKRVGAWLVSLAALGFKKGGGQS